MIFDVFEILDSKNINYRKNRHNFIDCNIIWIWFHNRPLWPRNKNKKFNKCDNRIIKRKWRI